MRIFDVAIIGAGPAGSTCAILAARAGLDVLLLDRSLFPRHKVCGDCLNPSCWDVFDVLGVSAAVRCLPHERLHAVSFESADGSGTEIALPGGDRGEITALREDLDALLLAEATRTGATVRQGARVRQVARLGSHWALDTEDGSHIAARIVGADGRNSTLCRLLRIAPTHSARRVALQAHVRLDERYRHRVALRLLPEGYCGIAHLPEERMNLCLVSAPNDLTAVRSWAESTFGLPPAETRWHSIAPLSRKPVSPTPVPGILLVGDAARVVEPFTGEGISYALKTGALAAAALAAMAKDPSQERRALATFRQGCRATFRDRLWVNHLARAAVTRPGIGRAALSIGSAYPNVLRLLTAKIAR
ncbi:geranylgeranyl reductase family protein [soil metagenome]